jgi:3-deoxy-D-manno-octulosonate 8-phosphate phosphatase (KDO 8-P phosphatase)
MLLKTSSFQTALLLLEQNQPNFKTGSSKKNCMVKKKIKILVMDVDGVLTDGKVYLSANGELFKAFNVKDGYAIKEILLRYGILPVIITGRQSAILEYRCEELGIKHLYQGVSEKLKQLDILLASLGLTAAETAYIGDDMNDYDCMMTCALRGCPADAVPEIKEIADFIAAKKGGDGAVREFIEWLIS